MERSIFWVLFFLGFGLTHATAQTLPKEATYPGASWEMADAKSLGWSQQKLEEAKLFASTMPAGGTVIVERGRVVAQWGDVSERIKVSSIRKSFLSALYGIHVRAGRIGLDTTLAQLSVDDTPPLTSEEKLATVRMLLQSRSGIFHPYVGGTVADRARMPARGSHAPGTFWYYNNWDFNALGTIFEQQTKTTIAAEFRERIAIPIGMQDLRPEDMYNFGGTSKTADVEQSVHPAYHFRVSARDAARFGYLYLRQGRWDDKQIIPSDWVVESTTAYSKVGERGGYGFLWWLDSGPGVSVKSYSAVGALGKYIIVMPERELVIVYLNRTAFPDDAAAVPSSEMAKLPTATRAQVRQLLSLILEAQPQR